jgi:peptidoglycan/LPS O-acetylase OafA/YrhL
MIGGPLLLFASFGVLFDWWEQTSPASILAVPEIIWEAFLGIYCAIWGFRKDSPIVRPNWRGNAAA